MAGGGLARTGVVWTARSASGGHSLLRASTTRRAGSRGAGRARAIGGAGGASCPLPVLTWTLRPEEDGDPSPRQQHGLCSCTPPAPRHRVVAGVACFRGLFACRDDRRAHIEGKHRLQEVQPPAAWAARERSIWQRTRPGKGCSDTTGRIYGVGWHENRGLRGTRWVEWIESGPPDQTGGDANSVPASCPGPQRLRHRSAVPGAPQSFIIYLSSKSRKPNNPKIKRLASVAGPGGLLPCDAPVFSPPGAFDGANT